MFSSLQATIQDSVKPDHRGPAALKMKRRWQDRIRNSPTHPCILSRGCKATDRCESRRQSEKVDEIFVRKFTENIVARHTSFVSQSHHRIDLSRSPRGNVAGEQRDASQQQ